MYKTERSYANHRSKPSKRCAEIIALHRHQPTPATVPMTGENSDRWNFADYCTPSVPLSDERLINGIKDTKTGVYGNYEDIDDRIKDLVVLCNRVKDSTTLSEEEKNRKCQMYCDEFPASKLIRVKRMLGHRKTTKIANYIEADNKALSKLVAFGGEPVFEKYKNMFIEARKMTTDELEERIAVTKAYLDFMEDVSEIKHSQSVGTKKDIENYLNLRCDAYIDGQDIDEK